MNHLRSLLGGALLAWLAACGPGTGGTGTGETHSFDLGTFGARAASVCTSTLASALSCSDTTTTATTDAVNPPAVAADASPPVAHFADSATGGEVHLAIEGNTAVLEARCLGLRFDGAWGVAGTNDARFFGSYGTAAAPSPLPATLSVDAVPGQDGALRATLRQADERVLLGPVVLQRVAMPVTEPALCR